MGSRLFTDSDYLEEGTDHLHQGIMQHLEDKDLCEKRDGA